MLTQKGEIIVGDQEKHTVSFLLDAMWGQFSIYIDGNNTPINMVNWMSGSFSVEVGQTEHHTVTFHVIGQVFFAAFLSKIIQVLVDGKLVKTF